MKSGSQETKNSVLLYGVDTLTIISLCHKACVWQMDGQTDRKTTVIECSKKLDARWKNLGLQFDLKWVSQLHNLGCLMIPANETLAKSSKMWLTNWWFNQCFPLVFFRQRRRWLPSEIEAKVQLFYLPVKLGQGQNVWAMVSSSA